MTLRPADLDVVKDCIGEGQFSSWIRRKLRETYPFHYTNHKIPIAEKKQENPREEPV